jgi:hypothetical protein
MTTVNPDDLTGLPAAELLARAERTATGWDPSRLKDGLNRLERDQLIDVLDLAVRQLVEPARIGQLDDLAGELADVMFDAAHEHCDSDGCTGGGRPYYDEFVKELLMPVVRRHAVPQEVQS